jgi:all-trans-retinol 13,14-reductase
MQSGKALKDYKGGDTFDAVVIGSGMGGLTTAIFLARAGRKVMVLERHYALGGFTHVFKRRDYEWDVGVHYLGDMVEPQAETARIFKLLTGGKLTWAPMDTAYDRLIFPDRSYDLLAGTARMKAQLKEWFPQETAAIDAYYALLPLMTGSRSKRYFAEKALPRPLAAVFGGWMRKGWLRYAGQTTAQVLDGLTQNPQLRAVLTGQWGDYGLPPQQSSFAVLAMVASHYRHGACYPVGGAAQFAETMVAELERLGGKVLLRAEVEAVLEDNGRATGVRMADGRVFKAPIVVSNAGYINTMTHLIPQPYRLDMPAIRAMGLEPSVGHVCLYIGLKKTAEELGLPKTNLWVYPGYDYDGQLAAYLRDPAHTALPLTYISFPSAKDPDFLRRFPGRSTIEIITIAPWEWYGEWEQGKWKKRGEDYEAQKEAMSQRLLAELYRQIPATQGHVDYHELSTPLSTRHFSNYPYGELYGLAHTPARFQQRKLGVRTPLKGFYMAGQDAVSCGVAGGMFGGVLCASAILMRNVIADAK